MLSTHSGTGGTHFAGGSLELGVGALTHPTLTGPAAVTDLLVLGQTGGGVQRAVALVARVVSIAVTHTALAPPVA